MSGVTQRAFHRYFIQCTKTISFWEFPEIRINIFYNVVYSFASGSPDSVGEDSIRPTLCIVTFYILHVAANVCLCHYTNCWLKNCFDAKGSSCHHCKTAIIDCNHLCWLEYWNLWIFVLSVWDRTNRIKWWHLSGTKNVCVTYSRPECSLQLIAILQLFPFSRIRLPPSVQGSRECEEE